MPRRSLVLTIIAGIAVFLVVLALYLPVSWFASALPGQLRCGELGGSIWSGECLAMKYQGAALGDATWNLAPTSALRGRLVGIAEIRGAAVNGRTDLDTSFSGVGQLRNLSLRVVLDPTVLPQLAPDQRGTLNLELKRLDVAAGGVPRAIEGTVELHDLRQLSSQPAELGSYQVTFDGRMQADGSLLGKLRDLGGPFIVDGNLKLTAPNGYTVQGYITGRSADAERFVREITLGATPDASGRSTFSFEGTW